MPAKIKATALKTRAAQLKNVATIGGPIRRMRLVSAARKSLITSYACALRDVVDHEVSSERVIYFLQDLDHPNLERFIDLGRELGVLGGDGPTYTIKNRLARAALANPGHMSDYLDEVVNYHGRVIEGTRTLGFDQRSEYLEDYGSVIAKSSLVAFPFLAPVLTSRITNGPSGRWLDLGAGSGAYTKVISESVGVDGQVLAIETSSKALEVLRSTVKEAGLTNVDIAHATMGQALENIEDKSVAGAALLNNLYYFDLVALDELFSELRRVIDGQLLVACLFDGGTDFLSRDLDLALSLTEGCTPLPNRTETVALLESAGFTVDSETRVIPQTELWCFSCS